MNTIYNMSDINVDNIENLLKEYLKSDGNVEEYNRINNIIMSRLDFLELSMKNINDVPILDIKYDDAIINLSKCDIYENNLDDMVNKYVICKNSLDTIEKRISALNVSYVDKD